MRALQITLFIVGLILLGTQSLRHVYVNWIEPTDSVLDKYREPVEVKIIESKELEELVVLYEDARERVKGYERDGTKEPIPYDERSQRDPYKTEMRIENAIRSWEAQSDEMFQLGFFWTMGLLGILLGLLAYVRINRWLGMVGIITGFWEMALWTSPLWRAWGPQAEFERLLTAKLILSLVSTVMLIALWLWVARRRASQSGSPQSTQAAQ